MSQDDSLDFTGLLASGATEQGAWEDIHQRCSEPAVRGVLDRAALEKSRQAWADRGLPPPWEPEEPEPDDHPGYDPGPEVDDEGGMSEYRHAPHEPEPWS